MFLKKNNTSNSLQINGHSMLGYPLNSSLILRKKHAIRKELLLKEHLIPKRIALLGGSTTAEIKCILELFLLNIGVKPEFYESEFNQYYEEAVFENQKLTTFKPEIIYIHTTNKNISAFPQGIDTPEAINNLFQQEQHKYQALWSALNIYQCPIIQNNFEYPQHRVLGSLDVYDPRGALHYINRLNTFFADEAHRKSNLYLNDINYLSASVGLSHWFDEQLWYTARYALSYEAMPHLAQSLAAIIGALFGMSKKCLALDLDDTCWGGVIGDDGLEGIALGKDTALGEAYTEVQRYLKLLKERGVLLAVCSKNEMEQAIKGFTHPDTVLVPNDFAAFVANWDHKYQNLIRISESLNLGLDSFVVLDDNPAERQIIQDNLPMVRVPNLTKDVLNFINCIDKNYYFETVNVSSEDLRRNELYQKRALSTKQAEHFVHFGDYLNSLKMSAEIRAFSPLYYERIAQLLNKTHQFNLTNKQYALTDIEAIAKDPNKIALYGRLKDCYGDHGLISVVIADIQKINARLKRG